MRAFPALLQTGLDKQNRMLPASSVASIIASALVVALVLWIVVACRRSHYTYMQSFLYLVNTFFARVLWRTQTTGKLAMPEGQGPSSCATIAAASIRC